MADINSLISVASGQVGYLEKKSNANLDDKTANAGSGNYTKYWRDLAPGMNGQSWCGCFVNWCMQTAYGASTAKKLMCCSAYSYYTPTMAQYFKNKGQWHTSNPQKGDIIFFKNSTRICHVGIVYANDGSNVYTIEGNTSSGADVVANGGGVHKKSYALNNSRIAGYGRPNYGSGVASKQKSITVPTGTLKKGSKGTSVKQLQVALNTVFASGLSTDGIYGDGTAKAVKAVQKLGGCSVDGIYGKNTRNVIVTFARIGGYTVA